MNAQPQPRRFLIMAGGTGGHVYPALSVADELRSRGHQISWIGTDRGIESKLVPEADIPLHKITVAGIRGKGLASKLRGVSGLFAAICQSKAIIKRVSPTAMIGFGGFVAGPGGVAAKLSRTPLAIHEQNARAGSTNKILARVANRVLSAFPNALPNAEVVGNPVRGELVDMPTPRERAEEKTGPFRLLVLGGSLGATYLNDTVAKALAMMTPQARPLVRHQCGKKWLEDCQSAYEAVGVDAEVVPYIEDMSEAYGWADFLVCRAGAMTVAEVAIAGVPALFVPFPFAIDDHQTANANWLVQEQGAICIQQSELTPERMKEVITEFMGSRESLVEMGERNQKVAISNAAGRIADCCEALANQSDRGLNHVA